MKKSGAQHSILVTGGAGFIGSNFVRYFLEAYPDSRLVNLDDLTYAGSHASLKGIGSVERHEFVRGNIGDRELVLELLEGHNPTAIVNFAAQTHVDRSIASPDIFIETNIVGTYALLVESLNYWRKLKGSAKTAFRFVHISTDEVFGTLGPHGFFTESSLYAPNSPYSASKASSDHLVRAFHMTYGLPVLTVNTCNNYGPSQHPEKLIPLLLINAIEGKRLPIYGDGKNVRDWLYVLDHCRAIDMVRLKGTPGDVYCVGSRQERTNLEVTAALCEILEDELPAKDNPCLVKQGISRYQDLVSFVADRPGHDLRYAIDPTKIERTIGWHPEETFESGLRKTIRWYLANLEWCEEVRGEEYKDWLEVNYQTRNERII